MNGKELKQLRKQAGMTQAALAAILPPGAACKPGQSVRGSAVAALSSNTVARWERDEVKITTAVECLLRLAIATQMPCRNYGEVQLAARHHIKSLGL